MSLVPAQANPKNQSLAASPVEGELFRMPLFRRGTVVLRGTKKHTVDYVLIRKGELWVHLNGVDAPVRPETLRVSSALFSLQRQPLGFGSGVVASSAQPSPARAAPVWPLPSQNENAMAPPETIAPR